MSAPQPSQTPATQGDHRSPTTPPPSFLEIHEERAWPAVGATVGLLLYGRLLFDAGAGFMLGAFGLTIALWARTWRLVAIGLALVAAFAAGRLIDASVGYLLFLAVPAVTAPRRSFTGWLGHTAVCTALIASAFAGLNSVMRSSSDAIAPILGVWCIVCVGISHAVFPERGAPAARQR